MKNIAVIIRGHCRTWEYNCKEIFKFYESIAENVEYYFVTWQLDNLDTVRITQSFSDNNQRLIKFLPVYPDGLNYSSWRGPSWLNYVIIPYKKQRELEIKYDAVFDTRPDILYRLKPGKQVFAPEPNTLYVSRYEAQIGPNGDAHIGIEDHFLMSSSEVHDRMNTRHVYDDVIGCQSQILQLATFFGIHTATMDWVEDSIVRPTALEAIPNPVNYFYSRHRLVNSTWMKIPIEQKLTLLSLYGIRQEDYTTSSICAKL